MGILEIILSIKSIAFEVIGYKMSYVELIGTFFGLICVWLTAKEKILCWPIGIINIVFFAILFYQVRLYSDMIL